MDDTVNEYIEWLEHKAALKIKSQRERQIIKRFLWRQDISEFYCLTPLESYRQAIHLRKLVGVEII